MKGTKKANFKKVNSSETKFFQFGKEKDGMSLMAKFNRILPENHHLQGIEFMQVEETENGYEDKEIVTVPSYNQLLTFFETADTENKLYLIEMDGEKELKQGRKVFLFSISEADLTE